MKTLLVKINFPQAWTYFFLASIFFPIRYVFNTSSAYILGVYSDFTSMSLYSGDILILIGFLGSIILFKQDWKEIIKDKLYIIIVFWLVFITIYHVDTNLDINYYFVARFVELLVLYGTIRVTFKYVDGSKILDFLIFMSFFQSILAIFQFSQQQNLGLHHVGESIIGPHVEGVAKIAAESLVFIRAYGTFPHANVFSAVLCISLVLAMWVYFTSTALWRKILSLSLVAIFVTGITLTFSRAGMLSAIVGVMVFGIGLLYLKARVSSLIIPAIAVAGITILNITILNPLLITRANVFDTANHERALYNDIGLKIVKENPVLGVGLGTSLVHMQPLSSVRLEPWQIQPIHNYYLLAAAEIGVVGSALLVLFFLQPIRNLFKKILKHRREHVEISRELFNMELLRVVLLVIIVIFLVLMLFDHYFYTIHQTQLLLWTILGIGAAVASKKNSTDNIIDKN